MAKSSFSFQIRFEEEIYFILFFVFFWGGGVQGQKWKAFVSCHFLIVPFSIKCKFDNVVCNSL